MNIWFLLVLGSAISTSLVQATQKWAVLLSNYSKITISLVAVVIASLILLGSSYFFIGFPKIQDGFWQAVFITGILNFIAMPIMLKAYEVGEFSSVYSMILLTPVFLFLTSFLFLEESPSWLGFWGVILTIFGLLVITKSKHQRVAVPDYIKGNLLGISVALISSVSVNFDKLATLHSDKFFAPMISLAIQGAGHAAYLFFKRKTLFLKISDEKTRKSDAEFRIPGFLILLILGLVMALSTVFHNAALAAGMASYTIAIKRTGILLGIFFGWLFFKEQNISKKLLGAIIAIAGVLLILQA